jgi:hypothetical protein
MYGSTILDLGSRWRWVVTYTPKSLYPKGNSLVWVNLRVGLNAVE